MSGRFDAELTPQRLPVECGSCRWTGKRMSGKLVYCPQCGSPAAFQPQIAGDDLDAVKTNRAKAQAIARSSIKAAGVTIDPRIAAARGQTE